MENLIKTILVTFCAMIISGCGDGNYRNVRVSGVVKDKVNMNPVSGAEVLIKCWVYSTENWESNTVEKTVITDKDGMFEAKFEKGEAIDVIVSANDFKVREESKTLKKNKAHFELLLEK